MYKIGEAKGIKLHAPKDAYFSYFNSPYVGHTHSSAIDIYPHHQEWDGPILSPITGRIVKLKKTTMGKSKEFPTEDYDYGIAIQPEESDNLIVRVLHCKPTIQEGNSIDLGDQIGTPIRSRYFNYWTGPHYHIELMEIDSFYRSTRSYNIDIPFFFEARESRNVTNESEFLITVVNEDHIIGFPRDFSHSEIGDYCGLSAIDEQSRNVGIIDGGISHYAHGGVIGHAFAASGSTINLQNKPIGVTEWIYRSASFFTRGPSIRSYLDDRELRGLSCFVYPKVYNKQGISPLILIPKTYKEFVGNFSDGDVCILKIEGENNTVKAE